MSDGISYTRNSYPEIASLWPLTAIMSGGTFPLTPAHKRWGGAINNHTAKRCTVLLIIPPSPLVSLEGVEFSSTDSCLFQHVHLRACYISPIAHQIIWKVTYLCLPREGRFVRVLLRHLPLARSLSLKLGVFQWGNGVMVLPDFA